MNASCNFKKRGSGSKTILNIQANIVIDSHKYDHLFWYFKSHRFENHIRLEANIDEERTMDSTHVPYRLASQYILNELQKAGLPKPSVGIICGSGLAGLADALDSKSSLTIKYSSIPGFPKACTVQGHKGEVVFGLLSGVPTACFRGRFHSYEGHDMKTVVLPVNVMRCIGVQICIVTNAAGGLNPTYNVGDVVAVSDHLAIPQLAGKNPLIGPNDDELGPRFRKYFFVPSDLIYENPIL